MIKELLYLGLDVHAENIAVAIAEAGRDGEVRNYGEILNTFHSAEKLLRKLGHPDKELRVCYEAGPCGFVLARFLKKKGIACDVIAPSLTPKGSGVTLVGQSVSEVRRTIQAEGHQNDQGHTFPLAKTGAISTSRIRRRRAGGVDDTTDAIRAVACIRFVRLRVKVGLVHVWL